MSSNKIVLPNFLKTLLIASLATVSVSAFAGHHEEDEKAIGNLKDMKMDATELKAEDMTNELDSDASKAELVQEAEKMAGGKADEMGKKAMDSAPN